MPADLVVENMDLGESAQDVVNNYQLRTPPADVLARLTGTVAGDLPETYLLAGAFAMVALGMALLTPGPRPHLAGLTGPAITRSSACP